LVIDYKFIDISQGVYGLNRRDDGAPFTVMPRFVCHLDFSDPTTASTNFEGSDTWFSSETGIPDSREIAFDSWYQSVASVMARISPLLQERIATSSSEQLRAWSRARSSLSLRYPAIADHDSPPNRLAILKGVIKANYSRGAITLEQRNRAIEELETTFNLTPGADIPQQMRVFAK